MRPIAGKGVAMSVDNSTEAPSTNNSKKRKKLTVVYWGIVFVILLLLFFYWLFILRFEEYTNDAYVQGNQVFITPLRPGFIQAIHTDDTYLVKKGQLLVELDRVDSAIRLERVQNELAKIVRQVSQEFHAVFAYQADIEVRRAELIRTAEDYTHRYDVLPAQAVSLEDFQHAVAALRSSYYALKNTEALFDQALAFVQGTTIKNHPWVQASAADLKDAFVQYYRCNIYSPVEGLAAQRTIQVGMWVDSGQPLLSVIPLDQIWVNANYKETQMKKMKIGQNVDVRSDLYGGDVVYHGKIVGLPGGAGNAFSLLPPQNLSGNWIKIVQRLPVRVELDPEELKSYPLRVGLSMETYVDLRDQDGSLVPSSNQGSPTYQTSIYEEEERGVLEMIERILNENIDPMLLFYADNPLHLKKKELDSRLKKLIPFDPMAPIYKEEASRWGQCQR
jgi:membrane fusion protein (multidrug efflux system)